MPVPLPNLDDRRFDDLMQEGRSLIPTYAPDWTNHNQADPGITILELFAYLTEMLLYQTNRITDHHRQVFLTMLAGAGWRPMDGRTIGHNIEEARRQIDYGERAVTCEDYERLAKAADDQIARTQCIPGFDLTSTIPVNRSNHVSILIIPRSSERSPLPSRDMIERVQQALAKRKLLAMHVHAVAPRYVPITVRFSVVAKGIAEEEEFREKLAETVRRFLDPLTGGQAGSGWPAGRTLYMSELLSFVHTLPHVEYVEVERLVLETDPSRVRRSFDGATVSVELGPDECFSPEVTKDTVRVVQEM